MLVILLTAVLYSTVDPFLGQAGATAYEHIKQTHPQCLIIPRPSSVFPPSHPSLTRTRSTRDSQNCSEGPLPGTAARSYTATQPVTG